MREWISNASDALDKIRSRSLTEPSVLKCQSEMVIKFISDKDSNTLTLIDAGIGMTGAESIYHLGTIVRSGTKAPIPKSQRNSRWRPKMAAQTIEAFPIGRAGTPMITTICLWAPDGRYILIVSREQIW